MCYTNLMSEETVPKLSIAAPDPIGRLYRYPGSTVEPLPRRNLDFLPKILSGEWVPSITNIIDGLNKPYLNKWAARIALNELFDLEEKRPGYALGKRKKAVKYFSEAYERDRDAAATQGSHVHEACEFLALGKPLEDLPFVLTDTEMKHVDAWKSWADTWQPEFLATEATVFGETEFHDPYAGTTDFVVKLNGATVIGDLKTTRSGVHNEVSLQLTAAARAEKITRDSETLVDNYNIDAGIVVHLSPDGFMVKQAEISDDSFRIFSGLRSAWVFQSFDGFLAQDRHVLSRSLSRPDKIVTG